MDAIAIANLIIALEPTAQALVVSILTALHTKNPADERAALESALRAQFEARQAAR